MSPDGPEEDAMPTILITGAARGIGRTLCERYAADGWTVLAGVRDAAAADLPASVEPIMLDVTSDGACAAAAEGLSGRPIDVLVNNAGLYRAPGETGAPGLAETSGAWFERVLAVNTVGPLRVTRAFLPNLRLGSRRLVATISSRMGSIASNAVGLSYAYRASKAGVNMVNACLALELKPEGFICVVLHPGWVRTEMGGAGADIAPAESVAGIHRVLAGLTTADTGRFISFDGSSLPW
jgi:NAD(P)-dependent dehydrogenase (short-subunit alcohol dehydrogenase family)